MYANVLEQGIIGTKMRRKKGRRSTSKDDARGDDRSRKGTKSRSKSKSRGESSTRDNSEAASGRVVGGKNRKGQPPPPWKKTGPKSETMYDRDYVDDSYY